LDRDDTIKDDRFLDAPDKGGDGHMFYSSCGSDMYRGHHHYHPYKRNDRGYFPNEFNKSKPLTFDGYLNKPKDAEAWLLGMKKFFELHVT